MSQFASIASPQTIARPPFRIFFAGRIEANKGIYDLVEIARRLNAGRPRLFVFDIAVTAETECLAATCREMQSSRRRQMPWISGLGTALRCACILARRDRPHDIALRGGI